ncbi:alpha-L-fucosidase [Kribbella swartbergensis]
MAADPDVLDVSFGGSFSSGSTYTAATGEVMGGTLTRRSGAESLDPFRGVVLGGGTDGVRFQPSTKFAGGRRSFLIETTYAADESQGDLATVTAIGGAIFIRYRGSSLQYGFSVESGGEWRDVVQSVPMPSPGEQHVLALAYEVGGGGATLHAFLDGQQLPAVVSADGAASWHPNAGADIGLGNEVHPSAVERGLRGSIRQVRLVPFSGAFDPAHLKLTVSMTKVSIGVEDTVDADCVVGDLSPARTMPVGEGDSVTSLVAKASAIRPDARQVAWQRMEQTAFLHFGINTFTGLEWGHGDEDPDLFQPTGLDTDQWARTLRDSGFKLAILTVKHHDGFLLYPSRYSRHGVAASSWQNGKGDVVRAFVTSMRENGLKVGFYLSPADENQYLDGVYANGSAHTPRTIPTLVPGDDRAGRDLPQYTLTASDYGAYMLNQLYELLTEYGPVDEVWFDGAQGRIPPDKVETYDFPSWYALIRELAPQATIAVSGPDVRWVGNESGLARPDEFSVVPTITKPNGSPDYALGYAAADQGSRTALVAGRDAGATELAWWPAEADVSIREGWFHHPEQEPRSVDQLTDIYYRSVGRNSVLLLNIPPDRHGRFDERDVTRLAEWRARLAADMSRDLARDARVTGVGVSPEAATDGNPDTSWRNPGTGTLTLTLPEPATVRRVSLGEDIRYGQQVESGVVEARTADGWQQVATFGAVGQRRILTLDDPVTTSAVRIRITWSRSTVRLSTVSVY